MNIQEILNMLDEDIARAEEQQPDNKEENIDFLLSSRSTAAMRAASLSSVVGASFI